MATKKKRPRGRPKTGRIRIGAWVLPLTAKRIAFLVCDVPQMDTIGKVIDAQFHPHDS